MAVKGTVRRLAPQKRTAQAMQFVAIGVEEAMITIAPVDARAGAGLVRKLDLHEEAIFRYCSSAVAIMGF